MRTRTTLAFLCGLISCLIVGPLAAVDDPPNAQEEPDITELRKQLTPVVVPDFGDLDVTVAEQLQEARLEMEAAIAEPDADVARLTAAYGTLGQLYHAYELFEVAQACYFNANFLTPQDFRWLHLLADVSRQRGDLEEAARLYEGAWSLQPYDFAALVRLGEVYLELGRLEEAETTLQSALALSPGSPSAPQAPARARPSRTPPERPVPTLRPAQRPSLGTCSSSCRPPALCRGTDDWSLSTFAGVS